METAPKYPCLLTTALLLLGCAAPVGEMDGPRKWQLIEELRLDAEVEDFSAVTRVVVGPGGRIAIPLQQDLQVRIYDSTGTRIGTAGRRGAGPGEFEHLGAVSWIGDTLFVDDFRQRRASYFGPRGEYLAIRMLPSPITPQEFGPGLPGSYHFFSPSAASSDGSIIGSAFVQSSPTSGGTPVPGHPLLVLDANGEARMLATPPAYNDDRWMITISGLENPVPLAFQPQTAFAGDGKYFAFLSADQTQPTSSYTVALFRGNGDTLFVRDYPFVGVPVPAVAAESAIVAMAPNSGGVVEEGPGMAHFQAIAKQRVPPVYSPVERHAVGLDGRVWVTLAPTAEGQRAVVIDTAGVIEAAVKLPPGTRIQGATERHLWVTVFDASGLTSVVRYRIERNGEG